jgi:hypothetical protein
MLAPLCSHLQLHVSLVYVNTSLSKLIHDAGSGLSAKLLVAHSVLTIVIPYLHAKLRARALSQSWPDAPSSDRRRRAWEALVNVESFHSAFTLANFVLFLYNGRSSETATLTMLFANTPLGIVLLLIVYSVCGWSLLSISCNVQSAMSS